MTSEIVTLMKQNSIITELLEEIKQLKRQNMEQEKKILQLENRVSELEQYSRMNDVIISGLVIRPRKYLQAGNIKKVAVRFFVVVVVVVVVQ